MQLWQILSQIHEEVDCTVHAEAWRAALLPPLVPGSPSTGINPIQACNEVEKCDDPSLAQEMYRAGMSPFPAS